MKKKNYIQPKSDVKTMIFDKSLMQLELTSGSAIEPGKQSIRRKDGKTAVF